MPSKFNLIGQKFGRLLVYDAAPDIQRQTHKKSAWKCKCICGNYIIVPTCALKSGNTKSCGCLHLETSAMNGKKSTIKRIKILPHIFSAKEIYNATYKDGGLTFEEFYELSQKKCFYCEQPPSRQYNWFGKKKSQNSYLKNINEGIFLYNGLDRLDSYKSHNIENVVSCCTLCNRAKSKYSPCNYLSYISKLINTEHIDLDIHRSKSLYINNNISKEHLYELSIKCVFNKCYNDGDLTIKQFYQLSQMNCYYCGSTPSNISNKAAITKYYKNNSKFNINTGIFIYNGLDRIDSKLKHNYNNLVACCKRCNFAKDHLSIDIFMSWIDRLKDSINGTIYRINEMFYEYE